MRLINLAIIHIIIVQCVRKQKRGRNMPTTYAHYRFGEKTPLKKFNIEYVSKLLTNGNP